MKRSIFVLSPFFHAAIFASAEKKAEKEITISGNDTMQFDVKNFDVTAGKK
jgi:azurin